MSEKRCVYKCGDWNCGSYQFNLYKDAIDQGELCDVHYWQTKAQREWQGLTEEDFVAINQSCLTKLQAAGSAESILKERNK
jgi:hypothetical protein